MWLPMSDFDAMWFRLNGGLVGVFAGVIYRALRWLFIGIFLHFGWRLGA